MRHLKKRKKLSRDYDHRRSLAKNLARALLTYGKIETTLPKAKVAARLVERMVSRLKKNELNGRRFLFAFFQDQNFVNKVAKKMILRFKKREGGITRIRKLRKRKGDDAVVVSLEFVDGKGGVG